VPKITAFALGFHLRNMKFQFFVFHSHCSTIAQMHRPIFMPDTSVAAASYKDMPFWGRFGNNFFKDLFLV
jgi:hypothetical protein